MCICMYVCKHTHGYTHIQRLLNYQNQSLKSNSVVQVPSSNCGEKNNLHNISRNNSKF